MSLKVGDLIPIGGGGYSLLSNVENFSVDSVDDQTVRLKWKDPDDVVVDGILITEWAGTQIRGKKGNYPSNEKDGELFIDSKNRNQYQNTPLEITGLDNDSEYFFMAFPYTDKNVFTVDSANRIVGTPSDVDDKTTAPGPKKLLAGDMQAGYFGVVPASELYTGAEISSACGISQGTLQFSDVGWLKFAIDGKIIFKSQKTYRHSISWDNINSAGCVKGTKQVTKDGSTYKVRLMRGALTDPSAYTDSDRGAKGSEWNRLMLPIHIKAKDKSWAYPTYVEDNIPYWGIDFTDADLQTISSAGDGSYHWCQETQSSARVNRGGNGVSGSDSDTSFTTYAGYGWSPVLELVEV